MGSIIRSVGTYIPSKVLDNSDFERILALSGQKTSNEWITKRTGIQTRHVAEDNETVGNMAYEASLDALSRVNEISPIEHIIVATNTHHRPFPNVAGEIQDRLRKIKPDFIESHASGSDSYAGCTGINLALMYADSFINSRLFRTVLVVGVDKLSDVTDYSERSNCILFGDGASAYILSQNNLGNGGFRGHMARGNGSARDLIYCGENDDKVTLHEALKAVAENRTPVKSKGRVLHMDGQKVFEYVISEWKSLIEGFDKNEQLNPSGISFDEISAISPHLANLRIFEYIDRKNSGFLGKCALATEEDRVHFCNTSTASQGRRVKRFLDESMPGDYLLQFGYGSGVHSCANLYQRPIS